MVRTVPPVLLELIQMYCMCACRKASELGDQQAKEREADKAAGIRAGKRPMTIDQQLAQLNSPPNRPALKGKHQLLRFWSACLEI